MARKSAPKMDAKGGKGAVRTTMTPVFGGRVGSKRSSKRSRGSR